MLSYWILDGRLNYTTVCVCFSYHIFCNLKSFPNSFYFFPLCNFSSLKTQIYTSYVANFLPHSLYLFSFLIYFLMQFWAFSDIRKCLIDTYELIFSSHKPTGWISFPTWKIRVWFSGTLLLFNITSSPCMRNLWSPSSWPLYFGQLLVVS